MPVNVLEESVNNQEQPGNALNPWSTLQPSAAEAGQDVHVQPAEALHQAFNLITQHTR